MIAMEDRLKIIDSGGFVELKDGSIGFVTPYNTRYFKIQKLSNPALVGEYFNIYDVKKVLHPKNNRLKLSKAIRMGIYELDLEGVKQTLDHMNQIMDHYQKR